jgi:tyrosine-protein kinase Etk/Wzc
MNASSDYSYVPYQAMGTDSALRAKLLRYLRHWYWFIAAVLAFLTIAFVYLSYKQPVYRTKATLLIKDEKKGLDSDNILKDLEIFAPKKVVENEIEILRSYTLMEQVVRHLNLEVSYYVDTPYGKREVYQQAPIRLIVEQAQPTLYSEDLLAISFVDGATVQLEGKNYPLNTSVQTPYGRLRFFGREQVSSATAPLYLKIISRADAVNHYLQNLKAEPTSKASTVIMLSIETAVGDKGEAILNRLVDAYTESAVIDKNRVAANTLSFIDDRLKLVSGELQTVERGVEQYKAAQGITDLSVQAKSFLETAQHNDSELSQVTVQLGALNDIEKYITSQPSLRSGTPATLGLSDPTLLGLIETFSKLESQKEALSRTTSDQNPLIQTVDGQLRSVKNSIVENVGTMRSILNNAKQQYESTNKDIEQAIRAMPAKERALMDITRQQAIKNDLYTYLLKKREETAVSYASVISDSRIVDAARTENKPVKPNRPLIYTLFALAGLLLPVGVLAFYDAINNRIKRRTDVEEGTQVPILGEVVKKKQPESLVIGHNTNTIIAEQIRTLRTSLNYLREHREGGQVLLFTSSIEGEGKSFISLNLGASLALIGMRTVILEMDLRRPSLRQALDFPDRPGISNYLTGETAFNDLLNPLPNYDNYYLITSGALPPNPSELLNNARMQTLISELRQQFDYILIDAPPVGLVTDAQIIAPFADATLYIVRHAVTPKDCLKLVDSLHKERRFNKLNIVLNAVSNEAINYYGYRYNSYNQYVSKPGKRNVRKAFLKRLKLNA